MASHTIAERSHGISVGNVFGRSANVIKANPLATLGTSFALIALPSLLLGQIGLGAAVFQNVQQGQYALAGVYGLIVGWLWLIAAAVAVPCWFACRRFAAAKRASDAWWLRYL